MQKTSEMTRDIKSMTKEELTALMKEQGFPAFRAAQLYRWMHVQLARDYAQMTNIPKQMAQKLAVEYPLTSVRLIDRQVSKLDGTRNICLPWETIPLSRACSCAISSGTACASPPR